MTAIMVNVKWNARIMNINLILITQQATRVHRSGVIFVQANINGKHQINSAK